MVQIVPFVPVVLSRLAAHLPSILDYYQVVFLGELIVCLFEFASILLFSFALSGLNRTVDHKSGCIRIRLINFRAIGPNCRQDAGATLSLRSRFGLLFISQETG
jgi:hypothetical protein